MVTGMRAITVTDPVTGRSFHTFASGNYIDLGRIEVIHPWGTRYVVEDEAAEGELTNVIVGGAVVTTVLGLLAVARQAFSSPKSNKRVKR